MATQLARAMIMEWGMSDKLGRVRYNGNEQEVFLGHSVTQSKNLSDDTAKLIDQEIRNLITTGEQKAREILHDKIDALHRVAKGLLEFETLSGEEVKTLMRGENIVRRDDNDGSKGTAGTAVPTAGRSKPREEPDAGGMAPQPQG
jgi:cell division protease FtsH